MAPLLLCEPWPAGREASRRTLGHPPLLPTPLDLEQRRMVVASLYPTWLAEQEAVQAAEATRAGQPGVA